VFARVLKRKFAKLVEKSERLSARTVLLPALPRVLGRRLPELVLEEGRDLSSCSRLFLGSDRIS
jgi:hypothetical protein